MTESQETAIAARAATAVTVTDVTFPEDLELARAISAGNRKLFKDLYDRNSHALFNLARRLAGTSAEAEDIVQEAFVKAYQKMDMFAGRSALSSWLYRICINVGLEHLRKKKGTFEDINDGNCGAVEPDQKKMMLKRRLERAIRRLPSGCRTVFVLHDVEGFNHKEIAERLCLAEGTSKSQLFKARAMLRKFLTAHEE